MYRFSLFICFFFASLANAIGLGNLTVYSNLNQPLNANIEIFNFSGISLDTIKVGLASPDEYARMDIVHDYFLTQIDMEITKTASNKTVIRLTSHLPVKEPILPLLIDIKTPTGDFSKLYSLLIDPPGLAPKKPATMPVEKGFTNIEPVAQSFKVYEELPEKEETVAPEATQENLEPIIEVVKILPPEEETPIVTTIPVSSVKESPEPVAPVAEIIQASEEIPTLELVNEEAAPVAVYKGTSSGWGWKILSLLLIFLLIGLWFYAKRRPDWQAWWNTQGKSFLNQKIHFLKRGKKEEE